MERLTALLLVLVAGAGARLPGSDAEDPVTAGAARVPVELVVLDGSTHSSFDRGCAVHEAACARARDEVVRLTG